MFFPQINKSTSNILQFNILCRPVALDQFIKVHLQARFYLEAQNNSAGATDEIITVYTQLILRSSQWTK